jgi:hypothetical protein
MQSGMILPPIDDLVSDFFEIASHEDLSAKNEALSTEVTRLNQLLQTNTVENKALHEEIQKLRQQRDQEEKEQNILPPSVREKLKKDYDEKLELSKQKNYLDTEILKETKSQGVRAIERWKQSKLARFRMSKLIDSYRALKNEINQENRHSRKAQVSLNRDIRTLTVDINPTEDVKSWVEKKNKLNELIQAKETEHTRHQDTLQSLYQKRKDWLKNMGNEVFPATKTWSILSKEIDQSAPGLAAIRKSRNLVEAQLGVPVTTSANLQAGSASGLHKLSGSEIKTFGGDRPVFHQFSSYVTGQFQADLDTELANALVHYDLEAAKKALLKGANIRRLEKNRQASTLLALMDGKADPSALFIKWVIEHGAKVNVKTLDLFQINRDRLGGSTLLVLLAYWSDKFGRDDFASLVDMLLDRHIDINAKNNRGDTALHWAANRSPDAVEYLLAQGANALICNDEHLTPAADAKKYSSTRPGLDKVIQLLQAESNPTLKK